MATGGLALSLSLTSLPHKETVEQAEKRREKSKEVSSRASSSAERQGCMNFSQARDRADRQLQAHCEELRQELKEAMEGDSCIVAFCLLQSASA